MAIKLLMILIELLRLIRLTELIAGLLMRLGGVVINCITGWVGLG
jgi:hypothetical protein